VRKHALVLESLLTQQSLYLPTAILHTCFTLLHYAINEQVVVLDSFVDPEGSANKGNVERWLLELEAMQWQSIRTQTVRALAEYPRCAREQWVLNWPAQVVLAVSQVIHRYYHQ
jgi:hypothetical protein